MTSLELLELSKGHENKYLVVVIQCSLCEQCQQQKIESLDSIFIMCAMPDTN
jgi:hypothetical protein